MEKNNLIIPELLQDARYLAHIRENTDGTRETETLLAHSELTLRYYEVYCEYKGMDEIVRGIIASCGFRGKEAQTVYLLFLYAIYLHDAGKINPRYQYEVLGNKLFKAEYRQARNSHHALASAYIYIDYMYKILLDNPGEGVKKCLAAFAYCISKHHGKLDNGHDYSSLENWDERYYQSELDNSIFEYVRYYMQETGVIEQPISFYILCRLLYALITGCDYCATQEFMTGQPMLPAVIPNWEDFRQCYDDTSICQSIRQYQQNPTDFNGAPINVLRNQLFLETEQNLLANSEALIYYLEAPTGSGKTNMAINLTLRVLEMDPKINNIFYIFPFNTLVEQTKETLLPLFGDQLAVINSITPVTMGRDDRQDNYEAAWLDHIFNNYPIVLTSHINFFNALFGCGRVQCFPLLKLCNSVVVLDEIQSYKNSIWREIISFLQCYAQQLNIKIIIMSATLPQLDKLLRDVDIQFATLVNEPQKYYRNPLFQGRVRQDFSLLEKGKITLEELKTGGKYKVVRDKLRVKEVWHDANRYIICYNPLQAEYDKKAREEMVAKLESQLKNNGVKSLVGNSGYRRYLLLDKDAVVGINRQLLKREARYDGKYVLRTNSQLDTAEVALAYKDLWRVERAFREIKSSLDLRPVYHWKDSRVRGHIMVCFLALVLESALRRKLLEKNIEVEYIYLLRDLQQLRAVEMTIGEDRYLCRTELVGKANEAFRALGIRPPLHIARLENKSKSTKEPEKPGYINLTLFPEMEGV